MDREIEKKILVPNSVQTRPGQENYEKNSKKIQKIKKPLSGIIYSLNGIRQLRKREKEFQTRIPFLLDAGKKIPKRIAKKFSPEFRSYSTRTRKFRKKQKKIKKIKKPPSSIIFSQYDMRQAKKEKKNQFQIPFILDPGKKIPKKI